MKLWSAFDKLEQMMVSSRDSDTRMGDCAVLWKGVVKSIGTVSMCLIGSSFMTWHLRCQEGDPVAISLSMDMDFDQTMRTLQSRSSFERQLEEVC
jgi:hypothetical protein